MKFQIDLSAPSLSANQRIWRLFPGNGYQFLPTFLNENLAFLDVPGFPLPAQEISKSTDLDDRVAFSQFIRSELYSSGPNAAISASLADFKGSRRTQARGRIRQALVNLLSQANEGDLIVVPTSLSQGRILIGRFADKSLRKAFYPERYGDFAIPSRYVYWLKEIDEGLVSTDFRKSLRHQHPFSILEQSFWIEVFALTYSSFVFKDKFVSTIYNEADFIDADASFLGNVTKLASAACEALENKNKLNPNKLLDILLSTPSAEYTSSQQIDIHSPGFNRYVSGSIVALVTAALVAAFMSLPTDRTELAKAKATMTVLNSSPDADPLCTARVHEAQKLVFEMLDIDKVLKLCEAARKAQTRGGLRSSATPAP